jgi:hypothetical protein
MITGNFTYHTLVMLPFDANVILDGSNRSPLRKATA